MHRARCLSASCIVDIETVRRDGYANLGNVLIILYVYMTFSDTYGPRPHIGYCMCVCVCVTVCIYVCVHVGGVKGEGSASVWSSCVGEGTYL